MPHALSLDLRSRIVHACKRGELTQGEMADLFQVHLKTVEKLWRHFRSTGSLEAKPHSGGVRAHWAGQEDQLRCLVAEQSDHTLAE
jgi:transposase